MSAILVMEMRGFTALASQLAKEMGVIGISPDRVRSAGSRIVNDAIESSKKTVPYTKCIHLGGDTWYFTFAKVEKAVIFACQLLSIFRELANEKGIFYIKPSMALNVGKPRFDGERFLDDASIATYKTADSGSPYHLFVLDEALEQAIKIDWICLKNVDTGKESGGNVRLIDWQKCNVPEEKGTSYFQVALPTLLLDSEVIYSYSTAESIAHIVRQQERSKSVLAFGGPFPFDVPNYRNYLRSTIAILKNNPECDWTVLSYLPLSEPAYSYAWLELCRRLSSDYPGQYAFAAFTIPAGQLRPFSYHIYDETIVHIGLRSFSPKKGAPTMNSAIMFRDRQIALRFKEEFMENWRRVGVLSDNCYKRIVSEMPDLTPEHKKTSVQFVDELLKD